MTSSGNNRCVLCGAQGDLTVATDILHRRHRCCPHCRLISVDPAHLPAPNAERRRYELHQNRIEDPAYVAFLRQALDPTRPFLQPAMRGLDYGCGPTAVLSRLLATEGWNCASYDPFFYPQEPAGPFDFLFATEVVEHFHHPAHDWQKMLAHLRPGGILTVMTHPWTTLEAFATWGYAGDETHVAFYHELTFHWLCRHFRLTLLTHPSPRVFVLQTSRRQ